MLWLIFDWSILERIIVSLDTNATPFSVASLAPDSRSYFTFDIKLGHERYEILSVRTVTSPSVLYSFCISRVTFNIHGDNATYEMKLKDLPVRTLPGTRPNLKFSGTRWAVCTSVFNLVWLGIGSKRTRVNEWPSCLTPNMGSPFKAVCFVSRSSCQLQILMQSR